jgi:hypothetical protein
MRKLYLAVLAISLSGCAAKMTLIDRSNGTLHYGSTDGSTVSSSGNATLNIDGEPYIGPWIYQSNGGSFSFSNFGATTTGTANATGYTQGAGFANARVAGSSFTTGSANTLLMSTSGNGMINARTPSGKFVRCIFSFNTMNNTGIGECLRDDGRVYDLTLRR